MLLLRHMVLEYNTLFRATGGSMDGNGLVSVIVPVYNTGPYLPRCIESITQQNYVDIVFKPLSCFPMHLVWRVMS